MPCPGSALPVAIETVPSRSKCTRCVRRRASESGSGESGEMRTGLFMSSAHHGFDHPVVRAAAAEVLVQRFAHLFFARSLVYGKQSGGGNGDAAHAIAAMRGLLG